MTSDLFSPPGKGGGTAYLEEGSYIVRLREIERGQEGKFGPTIYWHFEVADVLDPDGNQFVLRQMTSTKTGKNPQTGAVAKARQYMEALLGREVEDEEIAGGGMTDKLLGKRARAMIGPNEAGYDQIIRISPVTQQGQRQGAVRRPTEAEEAPVMP